MSNALSDVRQGTCTHYQQHRSDECLFLMKKQKIVEICDKLDVSKDTSTNAIVATLGIWSEPLLKY